MSLWTSDDAAAATGGRATVPFAVDGISIDTRSLQPGDLFVALKAARDGHDFVAQALAAGAGAALVSYRPEGVADDAPLLIVTDVLAALEDLGRAARARTQAQVVGITGSVGKTSTKDMMKVVLAAQGKTHAAVASYNNHWGVPLTLARMPQDSDFAVIEIGMNAPGEIAPLAQMADLNAAVITTVASVHLEAFDDEAGIAREKAAIMAGLRPGGAAILPADNKHAQILVDAARKANAVCIGFGHVAESFRLTGVDIVDDVTIVQAAMRGAPLVFKLDCPGRHFALNALAVLAAVEALGADPVRAAMDLARWQPPAGRGRREKIVLDASAATGFEIYDDAYNANPTSMAAALDVLAAAIPKGRGRRIAILGDMLELGPDERSLHAGLAQNPNLRALDAVHTVGSRMEALHQALDGGQKGVHVASADGLARQVRDLVSPDDVVLVKGSNGSKVFAVVDALRKLADSKGQDMRG